MYAPMLYLLNYLKGQFSPFPSHIEHKNKAEKLAYHLNPKVSSNISLWNKENDPSQKNLYVPLLEQDSWPVYSDVFATETCAEITHYPSRQVFVTLCLLME